MLIKEKNKKKKTISGKKSGIKIQLIWNFLFKNKLIICVGLNSRRATGNTTLETKVNV